MPTCRPAPTSARWARRASSARPRFFHHRHPPTGWSAFEGPLRPAAFDLARLAAADGLAVGRAAVLGNAALPDALLAPRDADGSPGAQRRRRRAAVHPCGRGRALLRLRPPGLSRPATTSSLPRGTMWRLRARRADAALLIEATNGQLPAAGPRHARPARDLRSGHARHARDRRRLPRQQDATPASWQVAGRSAAAQRLDHHLPVQSARCGRLARRSARRAAQRARHPPGDEPPLPPAAVGAHDLRRRPLRRLHLRAAPVRDRSRARSRCRSSTTTTITTRCIFYHAGDFFSRDNIQPGHDDVPSRRLHARPASQGAVAHAGAAARPTTDEVRGDDRHARPARHRRPRRRSSGRAMSTAGRAPRSAEAANMKLASLKGGRDGALVVVARDLTHCAPCRGIARTLQDALDDWARCEPRCSDLAATLERRQAAEPLPLRRRRPAPRRCRAPINGPTARPMSTMSSWCARRAAPRCRRPSGPIR